MNAHCERFNRTIQESFIDYHEELLLFTDVAAFNRKMAQWLVFYNSERPPSSVPALPCTIHANQLPEVPYVMDLYNSLLRVGYGPTFDPTTPMPLVAG